MKLLITLLALSFVACASPEPEKQAEVVVPPPVVTEEKVETIVKDEKLKDDEIKEITKPIKKSKKQIKKAKKVKKS